jgi:hypothetical protein
LKPPVRANKVSRWQGVEVAAMKTVVDVWWTRISGGFALLTLLLWAVGAFFNAQWSIICGGLGIFLGILWVFGTLRRSRREGLPSLAEWWNW